MSGFEDKRKYRRIPDSFIVTYTLKSPRQVLLESEEYDAIALDVSEGGVSVDSGREIPVGSGATLRFRVLNDRATFECDKRREIVAQGETSYCLPTDLRNYRIGFPFKNISDEDRAFLARYIQDQSLAKK